MASMVTGGWSLAIGADAVTFESASPGYAGAIALASRFSSLDGVDGERRIGFGLLVAIFNNSSFLCWDEADRDVGAVAGLATLLVDAPVSCFSTADASCCGGGSGISPGDALARLVATTVFEGRDPGSSLVYEEVTRFTVCSLGAEAVTCGRESAGRCRGAAAESEIAWC